MVKTSIIVPVYNTASYLKECFNSIFNQTQKQIEVIAINDGSTDNSLEILEEIRSEHPEMIICSQENKGLGAARNKGMELASGEYIYFIDSDDCLVSNAMEICYHYAKTYSVDLVMFDAEILGKTISEKNPYDRSQIIKEQEVIICGEEYARKYWLTMYNASACMVYTSACFFKKYDLKFLPEIYYEDAEFHCKAIPLAESVMYLPKNLYRVRCREDSITRSRFDDRHAKDYLKVIQMIDAQKHSANMERVVQQLKFDRLVILFKRCKDNDLLKNKEFVGEFYKTAQRIFGYNFKEIGQYRYINILYQLCSILEGDNISDEIQDKIRNEWEKIWEKFQREIPLVSENKCVGIYGTGKKTDEFLDVYVKNAGEIKSEFVFIESHVHSREKNYRNRDVFNVNDIGNMPLDCIVITSSKYEKEMYQAIMEKYNDKFKIVCLKSDLYFE